MNANELADELEAFHVDPDGFPYMIGEAITMLRQQAEQLAKYKQVLESIANEYVELSHDKIKWQNEDHIKWAKDALK
jgi:proline racemase